MTVIDALKIAHQALRKAVPITRKQAHKSEGALASTFRAAMQIWDTQKADGISEADRLVGLEKSLRTVWPFTREWKFLCQHCDDYGLVMGQCPGDATCGRDKPHLPHSFGTPCWCSLGSRFKSEPKPNASDFRNAGRTKPTRVGR